MGKRSMEIEEEVDAVKSLVSMKGAILKNEENVKLEKMKREILERCRGIMLARKVRESTPPTQIISIDRSKLPRYPPIPFLDGKIDLTTCSVPFEKQLTPTDVREDQHRLTLNKDVVVKSILPLLDTRHEDLVRGIVVTVYNPAGIEYEMMFKSWANGKYYVLNSGWRKFFGDNRLEKTHWVTVWMFRHIQTRNLCFALTWKLMSFDGPCPKQKTQKRIKMEKDLGESAI